MSNFKYYREGSKVYLVLGDFRLKIRWKERWVPSSEQILPMPEEVDGDELVTSLEVEDNALLLNDDYEIEGTTLAIS